MEAEIQGCEILVQFLEEGVTEQSPPSHKDNQSCNNILEPGGEIVVTRGLGLQTSALE